MKVEKEPSVFTPDNEPYLGRVLLYHFDRVIISCMEQNRKISEFTYKNELSQIQKAASQIIPQGINLALTIRELVRQGYLFGALVILRPLVERAAIISYLYKNQDKIYLWEEGWPRGKRPSLKEMLKVMSGQEEEMIKNVCDTLNHLTHGDPIGAKWNLVQSKRKGLGYSVGKVIDDPELCDFICSQVSMYLIVLMSMTATCFPDAR